MNELIDQFESDRINVLHYCNNSTLSSVKKEGMLYRSNFNWTLCIQSLDSYSNYQFEICFLSIMVKYSDQRHKLGEFVRFYYGDG